MSGWGSLLESEFLEKAQGGTTKNPKNTDLVFSPVSPVHIEEVKDEKKVFSPVLGVRSRDILKKRTFFNEGQKGQEGNINDAGQNITIEKDRLTKSPQSSNLSRPKMRAVTHPEQQLRDRVMGAAMRVCDYWADGEEAREVMRQEIKALPHEQLRAMLLHFRESYKGLIGSSSDKGRKQHE